MPRPLRVFFVSAAVLYALVLGWLVFETARIAAAVPPALPPFECCTPYLRGSAAVPLNAKEFDRFDLPDGSALSLRLVPSDGKTPALLFAVLTSPDAAALTVNSASLGSRSVLGSFVGHGAEVGYDGSTAALWTCFEVAPPLRDGSALSVSVTAVNSDGSRSFSLVRGFSPMLSDSLRSLPVFEKARKRLDARDTELLRKGVDVSLTSPAPSGSFKVVFVLFSAGLSFVLGFNLLMLCERSLFTLPLLLPAVALLALSLWLVLYVALFGSRFVPCGSTVRNLERFLYANKLYVSHEDTLSNGTKRERIDSSLRLCVLVSGNMLTVRAFDDGNGYTSKLSKLEDMGLCSVIGRPLDSKSAGVGATDYVFRLRDDVRLQAVPRLLSSEPTGRLDAIPLTGELSWNFFHLPHMLIAGATGGGKSSFLFYLVAEVLRLGNSRGFAGEVYICDPKNAELASLSHVIGSDRVGVSPAQIARVVRLCREEMDRRYQYMSDPERFRFGANAFTYGLNPVFLIFDEVAAFKAAADRKTYTEVWDNLTQLVLKARAANVFVILAMQQPRADTISTDIRDNLGARVSLGSLSDEGYRMTFGGSFDFLPIEERGTGYIMLDGWDAPKPFKAPFADYSKVDYPKELKRLYIAAQRRNGVSADNAEKEESTESVTD